MPNDISRISAAPRAPLLCLERAVGRSGDPLGYKWIEVLVIQPWAIEKPEGKDDPISHNALADSWALGRIVNQYICRTEQGLVLITENDIWHAIEKGEYVESKHSFNSRR